MPTKDLSHFTSFAFIDSVIPTVDEMQALFFIPDSELKLAIFRSYHWLRKAKLESHTQLRILFRWFAMETLAKIKKKEDITGKIMQVLGFPLGNLGEDLSKNKIKDLKDHSYYECGKHFIKKNLEYIRTFRNNTVHSGFRQLDINKDTLYKFEQVLTLCIPRLQKYAINALFENSITIKEFWSYFPLLYSHNKTVKKDLHGNILCIIQIISKHKEIQKRVQFLNNSS